MKLAVLFLAVALGLPLAASQGSAVWPAPIAQVGTPGEPVTALNDQGAGAPAAATPPSDSFAIASKPPGQRAKSNDPALNLWELVVSGGWAMIPLAFLSVVTVMLVLVFLFTLRRSTILTPHYMNTADVLFKKKDYLGLLAISNRHTETIARIVQRTLSFATTNSTASMDTIREIAQAEGSAQAASLQYRITYLADIGVLAPMIGLLGTVVGLIRSFGFLGRGDPTQSRDILLASGVSEALIATASGLVLGIVAMGFYGLFRNKVQALISDMEIASAHVLGLLALNFGRKRETSRVAIEDEF